MGTPSTQQCVQYTSALYRIAGLRAGRQEPLASRARLRLSWEPVRVQGDLAAVWEHRLSEVNRDRSAFSFGDGTSEPGPRWEDGGRVVEERAGEGDLDGLPDR